MGALRRGRAKGGEPPAGKVQAAARPRPSGLPGSDRRSFFPASAPAIQSLDGFPRKAPGPDGRIAFKTNEPLLLHSMPTPIAFLLRILAVAAALAAFPVRAFSQG